MRRSFQPGWIAACALTVSSLLIGAPSLAADVLIANGLAPPNPDNVIDDDTAANDVVRVRNVNCPDPSEPPFGDCTFPGAATTAELVDGGVIEDVGVYESSRFEMKGGTVTITVAAYDSSQVTVSGGTALSGTSVQTLDFSTATIRGGTLGTIAADDSSMVTIRGGTILDEVGAYDSSTLILIGAAFTLDGAPAAFGVDLCPGAGGQTLAGFLASGDPIEVAVVCSREGRIFLQEDPCAALTLTQGCRVNGVLGPCLGTPGSDVILGTPGKDVIDGRGGDDTIHGFEKKDLLCGGGGDDVLIGGGGGDSLHGENGDDILEGLGGRDTLDGGPGNDKLDGGRGRDTCTDPNDGNQTFPFQSCES